MAQSSYSCGYVIHYNAVANEMIPGLDMPGMTPSLRSFPVNYADARERFTRAVQRLEWSCQSWPLEGATPEGAPLTIEVASSPKRDDVPTLVLSSGLHGVEGYCGTAIQLQLLEDWAALNQPARAGASNAPLDGIRIILLHALNPYGYAWVRRADAANRDLNRSFVLPGDAAPPESQTALVSKLDPFLNPHSPPSRFEPFPLRALLKILRYGYQPVRNAIAGGQYHLPQGLFYGGQGPSELEKVLSTRWADMLEGSRRVVHLDFHSGLGKWSDLILLIDGCPTENQRDDLRRWYTAGLYRMPREDPSVYQATGSFGRWCIASSPVTDYLFGVAEFGTYNPVRVLRALRAENREHHWKTKHLAGGEPDLPEAPANDEQGMSWAKRDLLEAFCPSSPRWRRRVLAQGMELVGQTLAGLRHS